MTIKNLYPKARPRSIYNVINGRPELPAASTFSRASEATYVDSDGLIKTAGVDEPRFNYDPGTGEFLGLLLEQAYENLVSHKFGTSDQSQQSWKIASAQAGGTTTWTANYATAPDGTQTAGLATIAFGATTSVPNPRYVNDIKIDQGNVSFFIKFPDNTNTQKKANISIYNISGIGMQSLNVNVVTGVFTATQTTSIFLPETGVVTKYADDWYRVSCSYKNNQSDKQATIAMRPIAEPKANPSDQSGPISNTLMWGAQIVDGTLSERSIQINDGVIVEQPAELFSLTSSSNLDNGFSLLIDSDSTTDDYFYKVKANGTTIAELNNANGTLDWVVNGVSAATANPPEYPQVGAIQPGRVRTVSSFGAADGTTQLNYLYTTGLSFPTNAIVASGADEVEFGPGQTLKAVYLWNGQLSNTEAVSVIKGEYNIVESGPIKSDSYSFVYNTDPADAGNVDITLPYIVPTVSMRVYWGDGTSTVYEQGVIPSHSYSYPGQYRIQIVADDGLDSVRLGDSLASVITRVDQWLPEYRENATGPGYTGDQIAYLFQGQKALGGTIPKFKYTDLTSLRSAFSNCTGQVTAINLSPWDYIPTDLSLVTNLTSAFGGLGRYNNEASPDRTNFPTLTTSTALTELSSTWSNAKIANFVNDRPVTVSSSVANWSNTFSGCFLANLIVDTSAATTLKGAFARNSFVISPSIDSSNCIDFTNVMYQNTDLTTQLAWDTSKGENFTTAWQECSALTSFPLIDTSSGTNFTSTWEECSGLTSFPSINTSSGTNFSGAWRECSALTSFPLIDTSSGIDFSSAWRECSSLTSFPLVDTSNGTGFDSAWKSCSSLTSFPQIDTSSGTDFSDAWQGCGNLTTFPADMFNATGTLQANSFSDSWSGCALTAQSIENILVSLDTNGASGITLGIDGGTNAGQSTWSAAANTAYTNLINKGWTITSNP